jgi:hypothetical protein
MNSLALQTKGLLLKSDLQLVKRLEIGDVNINHLPQLYRSTLEFAKEQGNQSLNSILDQIPVRTDFRYASIDTRSHMLMKDMYPCIPGWHCDDFYRTAEFGDQPDLENVDQVAPAVHYLIVLGDNSRTEFLKEDVALDLSLKEIYKEIGKEPLYKYVDEQVDLKNLSTIFVESNTIYSFGPTALHRGSPATHNGWRYFIRVTYSNHRFPKNEIRYQTQVYTNGKVSW